MFPFAVLFIGIFTIWFIATGKAYQIIQVIASPVKMRGSMQAPDPKRGGGAKFR
jgi:hypothetical protein